MHTAGCIHTPAQVSVLRTTCRENAWFERVWSCGRLDRSEFNETKMLQFSFPLAEFLCFRSQEFLLESSRAAMHTVARVAVCIATALLSRQRRYSCLVLSSYAYGKLVGGARGGPRAFLELPQLNQKRGHPLTPSSRTPKCPVERPGFLVCMQG